MAEKFFECELIRENVKMDVCVWMGGESEWADKIKVVATIKTCAPTIRKLKLPLGRDH